MIPIKILCGCGQKYAFDVDPIGVRIHQAVQCPVCGRDGALAANQLIAQHLEANAAPASGLRIGGQQRPATVPLPRQIPTSATREANFSGGKVRNKWPVLALGGAVGALLVLAGVVMFASSHKPKQEPAIPLAAAPTGLPQTLVELNAWYVEPPEGQNAAAFYLKGFDAMKLANLDTVPFQRKAPLPALGRAIPASTKSALAAFVKSNQAALQLFAQGAQYDHCRYPVDLTLGYDALYPHGKKLGDATRLLELTAIYHAEANQAELAAKDDSSLPDAGKFARGRTGGDGVSCHARGELPPAWRRWSKLVNRTLLPVGALSELAKVFQKMEDGEARGEGFSRAMVGARIMALAALADRQQLVRGMSAPDLKMPADRRSQINARLQQGKDLTAEREFLDTAFRRLMAVRQEPFPARLKADDLDRQLMAEALDKKLVVLDLLLPSLGRRTGVEAECLARLRLGWTVVALEQFRAAHGNQYPVNLSELTPDYMIAAPSDPFDGQPLRYQKKGSGYMLYSIGPDLNDNSGERKNGKDGDIAFAVITSTRPAR